MIVQAHMGDADTLLEDKKRALGVENQTPGLREAFDDELRGVSAADHRMAIIRSQDGWTGAGR